MEEGHIAIFFCSGPRTGASTENVSRPITDLQKGQWWWGASERSGSRHPKIRLQSVSRKYSKNWLLIRKVDMKCWYNIAPKIYPTLKLGNCEATTQITHVSPTKAKCSRRFLRDRSWIFARVLWAPFDPLTKVPFFVCSCAGNLAFLEAQICKTKTKHVFLRSHSGLFSFFF